MVSMIILVTPYRPHAFEQQPPPSDFGSEFEFLDPSAFSEDDFSGDVDNYPLYLVQIHGGPLSRCV